MSSMHEKLGRENYCNRSLLSSRFPPQRGKWTFLSLNKGIIFCVSLLNIVLFHWYLLNIHVSTYYITFGTLQLIFTQIHTNHSCLSSSVQLVQAKLLCGQLSHLHHSISTLLGYLHTKAKSTLLSLPKSSHVVVQSFTKSFVIQPKITSVCAMKCIVPSTI